MMLKQVKNLFKGFTRTVDRIKIVPEKCFNDEEYDLLCRGGLTDETIEKINKNFNRMVTEVISLSAKGNTIYVECIGTAGEHFVTRLKMGRTK